MTADTTRIRRRTKTTLRSALQCVSMAGMLTAAMAVRAQVLEQKPARDVLGMRLENLLTLLEEKSNPTARDSAIGHLLREATRYGQPIVEDSTILFFYHGKARRVSVPGISTGGVPPKTLSPMWQARTSSISPGKWTPAPGSNTSWLSIRRGFWIPSTPVRRWADSDPIRKCGCL